MNTWNFFKVISIVYGLAMVFRGPVVNRLTEHWRDAEHAGYDADRSPGWLWFPAATGFFLMAYTWYRHFTSDVEHSWILAGVLTITIIELSRRIYNNECFKVVFYDEYIEDIWRTAILNLVLVLGGAMLLYMGLFIY